MKKTQNIIILIICLILIFLAYVFFKGGRVYLANFFSNISDQETRIVSDLVENINNQPRNKFWDLEEIESNNHDYVYYKNRTYELLENSIKLDGKIYIHPKGTDAKTTTKSAGKIRLTLLS